LSKEANVHQYLQTRLATESTRLTTSHLKNDIET